MADDRLSEAHLAERAGTTVDRIRALVELGILERDDDGFARNAVMRARVVEDLDRKGIDARALAQAMAAGELTLGYLESAGRRHPRSDRTFAELAAEIGISIDALERIFVAFGFPPPDADEPVREEDVRGLRTLPLLFGAGIGEGDVLQFARVWGDSVRKIAQFQDHYLHATIEEPFRRRGLRDNEVFEAALLEIGMRAGRSGENLLTWLFRRHAETFIVEHQFAHVETALEHAGVRPRPTKTVEAVAFADLTGYTTLTEEAGDEEAARVSLALAGLVSEIAAQHGGLVVKMLGDGVHFHFADPANAVAASLDLVRRVGPTGLPPAHIGVNAGPMIFDEGDYFGRTVNIAARIAGVAGPGQVFVGGPVVDIVAPDGFRFVDAGAFPLKGIAEPVRIFEALNGDR